MSSSYHEQCPDGVVDEDGSGCDEHAESYETIGLGLGLVICFYHVISV